MQFPLNLAIALASITAGAETNAPIAECSASLSSYQSVAVSLEIMDAREKLHTFARPEDFAVDLACTRRRYEELRDAPPSADARRFPDRDTIYEMIEFNRRYRDFLDDLRLIDRSAWIDDALEASLELYQVLDLVRDARCDYYYVYVRRKALLDLRDIIGVNLYYAGCLPPAVPVWYFRRIE